jgi:hypothetical protein
MRGGDWRAANVVIASMTLEEKLQLLHGLRRRARCDSHGFGRRTGSADHAPPT